MTGSFDELRAGLAVGGRSARRRPVSTRPAGGLIDEAVGELTRLSEQHSESLVPVPLQPGRDELERGSATDQRRRAGRRRHRRPAVAVAPRRAGRRERIAEAFDDLCDADRVRVGRGRRAARRRGAGPRRGHGRDVAARGRAGRRPHRPRAACAAGEPASGRADRAGGGATGSRRSRPGSRRARAGWPALLAEAAPRGGRRLGPGSAMDPVGSVEARPGAGAVVRRGRPDRRPTGARLPGRGAAARRVAPAGHATPDSREAAEALVQDLLLRVVSYFRPGLVQLHVWDVGQLTGSLPGLYPLTRNGLLTVHDPTRLPQLLDELSDRIRRVHTRVLVDGHPSLRALAEARATAPRAVGGRGAGRQPVRAARGRPPTAAAGGPRRAGLRDPAGAARRAGQPCAPRWRRCRWPPTGSAQTIDDRPARAGRAGRATPAEPVADACHAIAEEHERLAQPGRHLRRTCCRPGRPVGRGAVHRRAVRADRLRRRRAGVDGARRRLPARADRRPERLGQDEPAAHDDQLDGRPVSARRSWSSTCSTSRRACPSPSSRPAGGRPTWLPHARLIGVNVNTDREFGLALLQYLADEMRRRAEAAKAARGDQARGAARRPTGGALAADRRGDRRVPVPVRRDATR